MIAPEFIEDVLARTDIVEVIESRVPLKRTGRNHTGLCPFHNEKTPSFTVSQDKQFYYCFGCQASGSALKFLMEFESMDFLPAVEYLASRAGMVVPRSGSDIGRDAPRQRALYDILERSSAYFREQLKHLPEGGRAASYLKGRGLTGEIARDFGLGYAPAGMDGLLRKLATSADKRRLLIDAGMVVDRDNKVYDRFRDRIIFPIRDLQGRPIAFGGRVLSDDAKPKYLNSPETALFHKGRELYGLYEARKAVRRRERLLVVEGYMDVLALAQYGIGYSVATLGTATSTEHTERMFRLAPQVVFCFDGDEAGRNAAWKALRATLPAMRDGRSAKFLFLPDAEDPDSMVRKEGRPAFESRIAAAPGLTEFFFKKLEEGMDMSSPEGRAALSKKAVPIIREIPEGVFKQLVIKALAEGTGLPEERLLKATGLDVARGSGQGKIPSVRRLTSQGATKLLDDAIAVLLHQPEVAIDLAEADLKALRQGPHWQLLSEMVEWLRSNTAVSPVVLLSHYQGSEHFDRLCRLAEQELLLGPDALAEEFKGAVSKLVREAHLELKRAAAEELLAKPLAELSEEERGMLRNHSRSGGRG